jgi:hypothetical protein
MPRKGRPVRANIAPAGAGTAALVRLTWEEKFICPPALKVMVTTLVTE